MKTLTPIITAENFSECMNELGKEKDNIFLNISKQLNGNNRADGIIEKDRSSITYIFYDAADEVFVRHCST